MGSPCLIHLVRRKLGVFPPLIRMEIENEEIQDIIKKVKLGKNLNKVRAFLVKDHLSLSKAFSKSIFKIMLACLPFMVAR